jgi:hypothetical protein
MKTGLSNSYKLNNNIDASVTSVWNTGSGFIPVGTTNIAGAFSGIFDGCGYTINNLFINSNNLN